MEQAYQQKAQARHRKFVPDEVEDIPEIQEMLAATGILWSHARFHCYSHPGAPSADEIEFLCRFHRPPEHWENSFSCGRGLVEPNFDQMDNESEVLHVICRHQDTRFEGREPWRASYTKPQLKALADLAWQQYEAQRTSLSVGDTISQLNRAADECIELHDAFNEGDAL